MKLAWVCILSIVALASSGIASASDKALASGFAASATKMASDGKIEKAKDLCFRSLSHDEYCAEALFEMAKILELERNEAAAADFFSRALLEMQRESSPTPATLARRSEAERRLQKLNPYALRFAGLLEDYTSDLNAITKRLPDSQTLDEACDRAEALRLRELLPAAKAPKFTRPVIAAAAPIADNPARRAALREAGMDAPARAAVDSVPPEVETALKKAGWATISGTWKKKAENVYEVTDGKLETPKLQGAVQLILHRGFSGSVTCFVRNCHQKMAAMYSSSSYYTYGSGFGFVIEGSNAKVFTPYAYSSSTFDYRPRVELNSPLNETYPKNRFAITVTDTKLEYFINDKKEKSAPYKVKKDGPFTIEVQGTATLEMPSAVGQ